jgi:hypothetical protein
MSFATLQSQYERTLQENLQLRAQLEAHEAESLRRATDGQQRDNDLRAQLKEARNRHCGWTPDDELPGCKAGRDNLCAYCLLHIELTQRHDDVQDAEREREALREAAQLVCDEQGEHSMWPAIDALRNYLTPPPTEETET